MIDLDLDNEMCADYEVLVTIQRSKNVGKIDLDNYMF